VTVFMSLETWNAMKHMPPARAARNNAMLLAPGLLVMWLSSRDPLEGSTSAAVAGSAIRCHQCGQRNSGHAWPSEVGSEQRHDKANTKGMAGGGRVQSRIIWRPYNPNNRIFRTVVCVAGQRKRATKAILHRLGTSPEKRNVKGRLKSLSRR